jgi:hypothetical protein
VHLRRFFIPVILLLVSTLHGQAFGATVCRTPERYTPDGYRMPADAVSVCEEVGNVLGFFNGVANTEFDARRGLTALENISYSVASLSEIGVLFYNQTACRGSGAGKITCLGDLIEVFEQRHQEATSDFGNRWELFWEAVNGRAGQGDSWTGRIRAAAIEALPLLDRVADMARGLSMSMIANVLGTTAAKEDSRRHFSQLQEIVLRGKNAVLVAHSQGNLFANIAFDAVMRQHPAALVRVIHVAPASATLRGAYVLADVDLVIAALRATSAMSTVYPNLALAFSRADPSGHALEATYLDGRRPSHPRIVSLLSQSLGGVL